MLQVKVEELPDSEACKKINDRFNKTDNYDFIKEFGEIFSSLKDGLNSVKFPENDGKMTTIFFVGNTGSGKSTLVQVLGANNSQIFSVPINASGDFLIVDSKNKIGVDTVTSQTLYSDLLVDSETGYILCDNPGFRDTRSPIHEIVATYAMRRVLEKTGKIKIVIVSNQPSLQVGMYRDDFTNLLKHLTDFFYDIEKYKKSIYLIGTKAENKIKIVKGQHMIIPDESVISGAAHFLNTVKDSLENKSNLFNITSKNEEIFFKNSIKIIENLLEKNSDGVYSRIKIFRRPAEEGPLAELSMIQSEREQIRKMLLTEENMVQVNDGDFGFALTDSAVKYLNDVHHKMDSYITKLSQIISEYLINYYENVIDSNTDVKHMIQSLKNMKISTKNLANDIGLCKNPGQYAEKITNYSLKNKLQLDCLTTFQNITALNKYLSYLEDLTDATKYSPLSWNMSMKPVSDFIESKTEQINLLQDVFQKLSSYNLQINIPNLIETSENRDILNENNIKQFLKETELDSRYELVTIDEKILKKINTVINISYKNEMDITCNNNTLLIKSYFITLSKIDDNIYDSCENVTTFVFLAMHTIFIDKDLTNNFFKGKHIIIVAPIWNVIGSRKLSVDGMDGGEKLTQASSGTIGKYGENGKPGGSFVGIGSHFINGNNLIISACGGKGQDGQDGGDGVDGFEGFNGQDRDLVYKESKPTIYVVVNFNQEISVAKGSAGRAGGDAGEGGQGGYGGSKGTATLFNIGSEPHLINIFVEDGKRGNKGKDGKPGRGSIKGCDKQVTKKTAYILFIPVSKSSDSEFINCNSVNPSGTIRKSNAMPKPNVKNISSTDHPVCLYIMDFQKHYLENYYSLPSDGVSRTFINGMKLSKY